MKQSKALLPLVVFIALCTVNICQYIDTSSLGSLCRPETQRKDCGDNLVCIETKCSHCILTSQCTLANPFSVLECKKTSYESADKHFCLRGDLFSSSTAIWDLNLFGASIAAASGVGGGGIFIPILIVFGQFAANSAVPISKAILTGSSVFNLLVHSFRKHPFLNKPIIDYDAAAIMTPLQLLGTTLGVILVSIFPDWILILVLICILGFTTYRTFTKGVRTYQKETKAKILAEPAALGDESTEGGGVPGEQVGLTGQDEYKSIVDDDPFEKDEKVIEREELISKEENAHAPNKLKKMRSYEDKEDGPGEYKEEEEEETKQKDEGSLLEDGQEDEGNEFQNLIDAKNKKKSTSNPSKPKASVYIDTEEMLPQPTRSKTEKEVEEEEFEYQKTLSNSGPINPELRMILLEDSSIFPIGKVVLVLGVWLLICISSFIRGGFHGSISQFGVQTCSLFWWTVYLLNYPLIISIGIVAIALIYNRHQRKLNLGYVPKVGELKWTPLLVLVVPSICFLIGTAASFLGIGGGIFTGPLFFELGVNPAVTVATSSFMVLLTASVSAIQYFFSGSLPWDYALLYFCVGFVGAIFGELLIGYPAHKYQRTYILVFSVFFVSALALVMMGTVGIYRTIVDLVDMAYMGFKNFC